MKKYIVVKTNRFRQQKFYKIDKAHDSWSIDKGKAHKYASRRKAEKIAAEKQAAQSAAWNGIIEYGVEEVS